MNLWRNVVNRFLIKFWIKCKFGNILEIQFMKICAFDSVEDEMLILLLLILTSTLEPAVAQNNNAKTLKQLKRLVINREFHILNTVQLSSSGCKVGGSDPASSGSSRRHPEDDCAKRRHCGQQCDRDRWLPPHLRGRQVRPADHHGLDGECGLLQGRHSRHQHHQHLHRHHWDLCPPCRRILQNLCLLQVTGDTR